MFKKILLLAFMAVLSGPAFAQQTVSASDAEYLSEMPLDEFPGNPGANTNANPGMQDVDGDGIADNVANMIAPDAQAQEKKQVQYVYKPSSDTSLQRTIQDPRIDDGYVQSLMQQRGPTQ